MWLRQVVAALVLLVVAPWTMAAEMDCLFVEAAKLEASWPPASISAIAPADLNAIHRVVRGSGTVVLMRMFSGKKDDELDSEEFWKLTVELPNIARGETRVLQATAANTRFSRAGSAWVDKGFGYVGASVAGKIVARRVDSDTMTIDVSLDVETRFAGDPEEAQPLSLQKRVAFRRIEIADLTPWLGSATAGVADYWTSHRPKNQQASCSPVGWGH
ncbi:MULTISPECIES: hypothetical protein [Roseateles]|uniref:Uncharacterized protein n=1 Tax=Pelomonas caseinilytica TaxID=2906763 RepID=A0ABS8XCW8_9BURK|nr:MULTISPECIES: hypothetical protein [unclassified Roseateles]MCE4536301.1 hypothetical protein [Pelomonas sp. P7]HEV6966308.1 hypothetical protein [Roseateles sp.]